MGCGHSIKKSKKISMRREMKEKEGIVEVMENTSDSEDILDLGEVSDSSSLSSLHEISEDEKEEQEKKENISIEEEKKAKESGKRVKFTVEEKGKQKVGMGYSNEEEEKREEGFAADQEPKKGISIQEEEEGFDDQRPKKGVVSNEEERKINEDFTKKPNKGDGDDDRNFLRKLQGFKIPKKGGDFDCSFQWKDLRDMKRNVDDAVELNGGEGGNSSGCYKKNCGCHYNNWGKHCDEENAHHNMNKFRYLFSDDNPNSLCHIM